MTITRKSGQHLPGIRITPANDGGFIVEVGSSSQTYAPHTGSVMAVYSFSFAGSLDECLTYIRDTLSAPAPEAS